MELIDYLLRQKGIMKSTTNIINKRCRMLAVKKCQKLLSLITPE